MKKRFGKLFLLTFIVVMAVLCLYACGQGVTFTVTFHNGDQVYTTVTVADGGTITMPADPTPATGYTFVGWYVDPEGTQVFQRDGEITTNVDVYAKFAQQQRYVVVDSNGGSAVERVAVSTGAAYTIPVPTKEGYDFVKYTYVDAEGEKHDFATSGTYSFTTNVRITAEWTIKVYTVTLHVAGEEDEEIEVEHGNRVSLNQLTKTGYTFAGWFEENADTAYVRTTPVTADLDLYARFTANTYRITFDTVGGTAVADYTATYGQAYELTAPTKTGYTFAGYTLDGQAFALTGTWTRTSGARLVANWTINTYDVTFLDAESGERIGEVQHVAYNAVATLPTVATGYEIEGVYATQACDGDKIVVNTTKITENKTFYVNVKGQNFTVSYKVNGGNAIDQLNVEYGKAYTLTEASRTGYDFVKYTIDVSGVETDIALTGTYTYLNNITVSAVWQIKSFTVTFLDGTTILKTEPVDYNAFATAVNPINGYDIDGYYTTSTFDANSAVTLANYPITEATTIYVKKSPKAATLTVAGWEEASITADLFFDGTYTLPDPDDATDAKIIAKVGTDVDHPWLTFTGYTYNDEAFAFTGTVDWVGNITVTPVYTENPDYDKCTVTFTDGITGTSAGAAQTFARGNTATYFAAPAKTGYTFVKWSLTNSVDAAAFDWSTAISVDTTVYAVYQVNQYTVTLDKNNGQPVEQFYVNYGEVLNLYESLTKRGYTFDHYEYNNQVFANGQAYLYTTGITVTAIYTQDKRDVEFYVEGSLVDTVEVNQYDAVTPIADPSKTGYTFQYWSLSANGAEFNLLTEIENNTKLYAVFTVNNYKVTIDENGGDEVADIYVDYGATLTLPATMTKRGYTFTHFTYNDQEYAGGAYTFTTGITVVAQYTRNTRTVNFRNDEGALYENGAKVVNQYDTVEALADPSKTGYTFLRWSLTQNGAVAFNFATEIENNTDLYAVFEVNHYTISVEYTQYDVRVTNVTYGEEYDIDTPIRTGYTYVRTTESGETFADENYAGTYLWERNLYLIIVWEDHSSMSDGQHYFLKTLGGDSEQTLILVTGAEYTFDNYGSVSGGEAYYTKQAANKIKTNASGDFTMSLYDAEDNFVKSYKTKIVSDVVAFDTGKDFNTMIAGATTDNFKVAVTRETYVQTVGAENYLADLKIQDDKLNDLNFEDANLKITVKEGNTDIDSSLIDVTESRIDFDNSLVGKTLTLSFIPEYDVHGRDPITLTVLVNDGKNVYTNEELKNYYSNTSVHTVNILRNIKAELAASDYINGHGKQIGDVTIYKSVSNGVFSNPVTLHDIDLGAPINDTRAHGVYVRTGDKNDSITVNGNYFAIDGSKLPYIDNRYGEYGSTTEQYTAGGGNYLFADVQIGIFFYQSADLKANGYRARKWASGTAEFNNLRIESNSLPEYGSYVENIGDPDGKGMLKMSAGYHGMVLRGGTVTTNNVAIKNATIATMMHGQVSGFDAPGYADGATDEHGNIIPAAQENEEHAMVLTVKNGITKNCWCDSFYVYDLCVLTMENTDIGMSFGPAIAVDDKPYAWSGATNANKSQNGYSNLNTVINMDHYTATNVNSFITGSEVYYVAMGLVASVGPAKDQINAGVQSVDSHLTIIKNIDGAEKMNLVIMVKQADSDQPDWWTSDKQGKPFIDTSSCTAADLGTAQVVAFGTEDELSMSPPGSVMANLYAYNTQEGLAKLKGLVDASPYIAASAGAAGIGTVLLYVPFFSTVPLG